MTMSASTPPAREVSESDGNPEIELAKTSTACSDREIKETQSATYSPKFTIFSLLLCFATGLFLCWRTNYSHAALDVASMFDSGKYISSSEAVLNATGFLHHFTSQEWSTICGTLKEPLMMDGPVLPLIGAVWFTLIGKSPDLFDMRAALALQALLHASSACIMFFAARRLFKNQRWALTAAILWAAFPSAVLGAGRFMTENLSSTLLLLMVGVVPSRLSDKWARSLVLGVTAAAVILLKAALLPGIVIGLLLVGISLCTSEKQTFQRTLRALVPHAISLTTGALIVLLPWLAFTKEATGQYSITAQREPVLNIVIGGNTETDGWSGNPETDFVKLFDTVNGDKAGTFLGIWQSHLPELSNIAVRRICRLWSCPWNDCLSKFMGLGLPQQWLYHQAVLNLALLGALLLAFRKESANKSARVMLLLGGTILLAHLIYVVFNASPRQAFTSMPFIVLLMTYSVCRLATCNQKKIVSLALIGAFALWLGTSSLDFHSLFQTAGCEGLSYFGSLFVFMLSAAATCFALVRLNHDKRQFLPSFVLLAIPASILCAAFACAPRSGAEWQCHLKPSATANRSVYLPAMTRKPDWAVLVVDGDFALSNASITVNQTKIEEKLSPLNTFTSSKTGMVNYAVFGGVSNKNPEQLRQWRAVQVPLAALQSGDNTITIRSLDGNGTIYGAFTRMEDGKLIAPTLFGFSGCKLLSETQPLLEPRYGEPLTANAAKGRSWLSENTKVSTTDLSPSFGTQIGQYRAFLCLGFNKNFEKSQSGSIKEIVLEPSAIQISEHRPFMRRYPVPQDLGSSTFTSVGLTGELSGESIKVLSKVNVRNMSNLGSDLCLPNSVTQIEKQRFELQGSLPTASLNQPNEFFEVQLQSKQPVQLEKLAVKISPAKRPDFAQSTVSIY